MTLLPMMADFNIGEGIAVDPEQLHRALEQLLSDQQLGTVWFIDDAGRTAGYAVVTFGYDLEWAGRDAFLTELYLLPGARGRGLGTKALAEIERNTADLGARALHLMVRPENLAAVRLYRGAGYESPPRLFLTKPLG